MNNILINLWTLNIVEIYDEPLVLSSNNRHVLASYSWSQYYRNFRQTHTAFYSMSSAIYDLLMPLKNISLNN